MEAPLRKNLRLTTRHLVRSRPQTLLLRNHLCRRSDRAILPLRRKLSQRHNQRGSSQLSLTLLLRSQ